MISETMILSKRAALPAASLFFALGFFALQGCNKAPEADTPAPKSGQTAPAPLATKPIPPDDALNGPDAMQADGVKRDIETALASNSNNVFPKGVKLNSAEIKAGVLSLDFNAEFNGVANLGESGESEAQKELIRIAAGHSAVEKMRVTVNGKPFQSQATDWNTPFSVHPSAKDGTAADAKAGR